jgi:hypothetical protein
MHAVGPPQRHTHQAFELYLAAERHMRRLEARVRARALHSGGSDPESKRQRLHALRTRLAPLAPLSVASISAEVGVVPAPAAPALDKGGDDAARANHAGGAAEGGGGGGALASAAAAEAALEAAPEANMGTAAGAREHRQAASLTRTAGRRGGDEVAVGSSEARVVPAPLLLLVLVLLGSITAAWACSVASSKRRIRKSAVN